MMNIVLMGAPGAGKGTQADLMEQRLHVPHVASGDLFRTNIRNGTELGKRVKAILDSGDLVPDSITIDMIRQRMSNPDCANGIILDGFPRTIPQADALDALFAERNAKLDRVLYVKVSDDKLMERLSGRWSCPICQTAYHIKYNPPIMPGKCDKEGGELIQRADDKIDVVANRLQKYNLETAPLIAHYQHKGILAEINGEQDIEKVYAAIATALNVSMEA